MHFSEATDKQQKFYTGEISHVITHHEAGKKTGNVYLKLDYSANGTELVYGKTKINTFRNKSGELTISHKLNLDQVSISESRIEIVAYDADKKLLEIKANGERVILDLSQREDLDWASFDGTAHHWTREVAWSFFKSVAKVAPQKDLSLNAVGWTKQGYILRDEITADDVVLAKQTLSKLITTISSIDDADDSKKAAIMSLAVAVASCYCSVTKVELDHNLLLNIWSRKGGKGKSTLVGAITRIFSQNPILDAQSTKASIFETLMNGFDQVVDLEELHYRFQPQSVDRVLAEVHSLLNGKGNKKMGKGGTTVDRTSNSHIIATANRSLIDMVAGRTESDAFLQRTLSVEMNSQLHDGIYEVIKGSKVAAGAGAILVTQALSDADFIDNYFRFKANLIRHYGSDDARLSGIAAVLALSIEVIFIACEIEDVALKANFSKIVVATVEDNFRSCVADAIIDIVANGYNLLSTAEIADDFKEDDRLTTTAVGFRKMTKGSMLTFLTANADAFFKKTGQDLGQFISALKQHGLLKVTNRDKHKVKLNGKQYYFYAIDEEEISEFIRQQMSAEPIEIIKSDNQNYNGEHDDIPF